MRKFGLFRNSTFRVALSYIGFFCVSVLILFGFIYWSTVSFMVNQVDADINTDVKTLMNIRMRHGAAYLVNYIRKQLDVVRIGSPVLLITDHNYKIFVGNIRGWPTVAKGSDGWLNLPIEIPVGENKVETHLIRAQTLRLPEGFKLLVGRDIHHLTKMRELLIKTLIWSLIITVALGLLGGILLSRSVMRRIDNINETCREIMSGDLSRRIDLNNTNDDFDQLAEIVNTMLDKIEHLISGVRQISDNIAHDLRTPLARIRNRLEQVQKESGNEELQQKTIEQAISDADGLLATFNSLLRIARIESRQQREGFAQVDLAAIIYDVIELYEPLAEEKQQYLHYRLDEPLNIQGDQDLLFQAFANVLDNAIKYTPEKGSISVGAIKTDSGVQVTIADSGSGIPDDAKEKVFQRMFRMDYSRTTAGNGLGLSLVSAVVELHKGQIELVDNQPGLRVIFHFSDRSN